MVRPIYLKSSIPALLAVIFTIIAFLLITACEVKENRLTSNNFDSNDVFITDEVARVVLYMKPEIWNNLLSRAKDEEYKQADFWFNGEALSNVAVRAKGSSSLTYVVDDESDRLSLKVDFNLLNDALTFHGLKKLNFHNNYRDPTLMRERLSYELFAEMGVPAPRATHVDFWVNDFHMGVYTQVEQVDRTFLKRVFGRDDGTLYKPIPPGSYLDWTSQDLEKQRAEMNASESPNIEDVNIGGGNLSDIEKALSVTSSGTNTESDSGGTKFDYIDYMKHKTNTKKQNHSELLKLIDILNNEPDSTFPEKIERVLDVDEVLRFFAVETTLVCLDSYYGRGVNFYLYEIDGKFAVIPWDLNESFGTYKCGLEKPDIIDFFIDEPTCGPVAERPLVDRLLSHPPYRETYHSYLTELIEGPFSTGSMNSRIDELAEMIRPYVANDELKFYSTEEFDENLEEDSGRYFGLKSFVAQRGESIRQQLEGELPSTNSGLGNEGDPDEP